MSETVQAFWNEVKGSRDEIVNAIQSGNYKQQPRPRIVNGKVDMHTSTCYIISRKNRSAHTDAGVISEVNIALAGQRITEETHELANDDQIIAYKAAQAEAKKEIGRLEHARKSQTFVTTGAEKG